MTNQSETIGELAKALCVVQAQLRPAKMDAENPFFHSKYATLESCWNACRDLLSSNGLAVVQSPGSDGNGRIEVRSTLVHTSGEWMSATVSLRPVKDDPQAAGSAITYGRRYGLCALVGIVTNDDDDANACSATRETSPKVEPYKSHDAGMPKHPVGADKRWDDTAAERERIKKQKAAQKKADAQALVKDVADTLGAEVVRGSEIEDAKNRTPAQGAAAMNEEIAALANADIKVNKEYKTRQPEIPPVKIEARFLRTQGRAKVYTLLEDGQDVGELFLPATQIAQVGKDTDGKEYVWVSTWIAEKKIKEGKLQPEQVIWKEHDKARGDAWEGGDEYPEGYPPEGSEDV
jgi:hypothetical protein